MTPQELKLLDAHTTTFTTHESHRHHSSPLITVIHRSPITITTTSTPTTTPTTAPTTNDNETKIVQMISGLTHTFLLDGNGRVFGDLKNGLFQEMEHQQQQQLTSTTTPTSVCEWRHAKWFDDKQISMIVSGYYYLILVSIVDDNGNTITTSTTTTTTTTSNTSSDNDDDDSSDEQLLFSSNKKVIFYHFDYRTSKISMRRWTSEEYAPLKMIDPSCSMVVCGAYHTIVLTNESNGNCYGFHHPQFKALQYDELPCTVALQHRKPLYHLNHPVLMKERIVQVVAGYRMTLFLSERGELFVCGVNVDGCLFLGHASPSESLRKVRGLPGLVKRVWCGYRHAMIQLSDDRYFVCGANDRNQLSFCGHTVKGMSAIVQPVAVTLPENTVHVELNGFRSFFTTSDRRVYCYGGDANNADAEGDQNSVMIMEQPPVMDDDDDDNLQESPERVLRMTSGALHTRFYYADKNADYDHLAPLIQLASDHKSV